MQISKQDFELIKRNIINLYFIARQENDFYTMETCDFILHQLSNVENENIKRKQAVM